MRAYVIVVACIAVLSAQGKAQSSDSAATNGQPVERTEWTVMPFASYGMHEVDFNSLPPVENCCIGFENTTGIGFGMMLGTSIPLNEDGLRLALRAGYHQMPAAFSSFSTKPVWVPGMGTVNAVFKEQLDVTYYTIPVDASLEVRVASGVSISVGAQGYYVASTSFSQSETFQEPAVLTFENDNRTRNINSGSLSGYNALVFNGIGSLRTRVASNLGSINGIDVVLSYIHPLSPLFDPQQWTGRTQNPAGPYYITTYNISILTAGVAIAF